MFGAVAVFHDTGETHTMTLGLTEVTTDSN